MTVQFADAHNANHSNVDIDSYSEELILHTER